MTETIEQPTVNFKDFIAQQPHIPKPVMAFLLECPDWFNETQQAAIKRIVEMSPTISGLLSGYGGDVTDGVISNRTSSVRFGGVVETYGRQIGLALESIILDKRTVNKGEIGPLKILFIEPDNTYTQAVDAWEVEGTIDTSGTEQRVRRDIVDFATQPMTYMFDFLALGPVKYGPATRTFGSTKLSALVQPTSMMFEDLLTFVYDSQRLGRIRFSPAWLSDQSPKSGFISVEIFGDRYQVDFKPENEDNTTIFNPDNALVVDDLLSGVTDALRRARYPVRILSIHFPLGRSIEFNSAAAESS